VIEKTSEHSSQQIPINDHELERVPSRHLFFINNFSAAPEREDVRHLFTSHNVAPDLLLVDSSIAAQPLRAPDSAESSERDQTDPGGVPLQSQTLTTTNHIVKPKDPPAPNPKPSQRSGRRGYNMPQGPEMSGDTLKSSQRHFGGRHGYN
jgi:hypothetical protein